MDGWDWGRMRGERWKGYGTFVGVVFLASASLSGFLHDDWRWVVVDVVDGIGFVGFGW